jgi:serine/threonine protein kinase
MFYETCPNCFCDVYSDVCPNCGYDQSNAKQYEEVLSPQTILNARYLLGRVLGKGGFGVTYLAKDLVKDELVAVKECMPEYYSYRDLAKVYPKVDNTVAFNQCKANFEDEAKALYELKGNSFVVDILNYFSENNTNYFVMEYVDGVSLKVLTHSQGGKTSVANSALVLFTVGSALMEVHKKGIIHRDISPENIMIARDGSIKLIDFGACKNYMDDSYYRNESIFLKPGFAPPEQYDVDGNQGPWTDVYALAATFYTIISGQPLIDSTFRLEEDTMKTLDDLDCGVSPYISAIVSKALQPEIEYRYSNVGDFLNDMADLIELTGRFDTDTLGVIESEKKHENKVGSNEGMKGNVLFPYVQIVSGLSAGNEVRIPDYGFISIGRDTKVADITLNDFNKISRYHCLVGYDRSNNRFIVIDKSANGTFYSNGQRMMYNAESYILPNEDFLICNNGIKVKVRLQ